MKCKKRYLGLILSLCMTSSIFVGCSNEKTLYSENVEATTSVDEGSTGETSSNNNLVSEDEDISQELIEEANDVKRLTRDEALKLVETEVKKVFPNAKLKLKSEDYPNREGFYVIQYDAPYCTTAEFVVDSYNGYIQACEEGTSDYVDMDTWRKEVEGYLNGEEYELISAQEAMSKFVSKYNFNETHERAGWIRLSDNQLNNFELVSNELVEYESGHCAWVFRYPMEEEHDIYENSYGDDCTRRNAVSKNDKYAYIFFEPLVLNSSDKVSWYYSHVCDSSGTYFYWEDYPSKDE